MTGRVQRRPAARRDLVDILAHLAREGRPSTARRFRVEAEATFARLASMPGLGALHESEDLAHAGLRVAPVSRFRAYLVFYRPIADGIEVVRVLHGARDLGDLLAGEFGLDEGEG